MSSQKHPTVVTPAKAGVQNFLNCLDSSFHGNDRKGLFLAFYATVKLDELVKSRHPGENRGPEVLQVLKKTGFRLSPE
jgi:hypothetical protein